MSFDGNWKLISSFHNQGRSNVQEFYEFVRCRVQCPWNLLSKWWQAGYSYPTSIAAPLSATTELKVCVLYWVVTSKSSFGTNHILNMHEDKGHFSPYAIPAESSPCYSYPVCFEDQPPSITELFCSSPPRQNGHHFADNIFKCIFVNENFYILNKISLKFVPKGPMDDPALVKIMAWHQIGDKPLSGPCWPNYLTYIWALGGDELINKIIWYFQVIQYESSPDFS